VSDVEDQERLRYLRLKAKAAQAQAAQPSRVFTGAPERAEEEQKLTDSLNPLERLAIGAGHGMRNVDLNIRDIIGRLPGMGGRPDPKAWGDEEAIYGRTLAPDVAAGVGDLTGQTAMLAPIGGAAGAATRAVLPPALAAVAPLLALGGEGAAQGAVAAGPENRAQGALTGLKFGLGTGAAGQVLGKIAQLSGTKADDVLAAQVEKARAAKAVELRRAGGEVGSATQKGSRLEEQFSRYVDDPNVPTELRAAIAQWKASPRSQELLSDVLTNQLEQAPAVSGEIAGKQQTLRGLQEGADEAVRATALSKVSPEEARRQVGARLLRYGLPALGGYLGHHFLGEMGGMMGLAGGSVLRPMMHSLKHLTQNPAFQTSLLRAAEGTAGGLSGLAETAALGEGGLIPFARPEAGATPAPLLADGNSGPQTLAQLILSSPFARRQDEAR
jgi:hypothetical protein